MPRNDISRCVSMLLCVVGFSSLLSGCGAPAGPVNANVNTNINAASPAANTNSNTSTTSAIDAREPDNYQATVTIKFEAMGGQNAVTMPTLGAKVARNGNDRRMEFTGPVGGRIVYLDKGDKKYLILPDKNQYAELDKDSTGFEIRRMMMPSEIVKQVKATTGLQLVGDDTLNGRPVSKYRYASAANTGTAAGNVNTESFLFVDKDTGLPLRSETTSQATGNVKGYNALRIITEMSDITTSTTPDMFAEPTSMQKIENEQVRAQVNMLFQAAAAVVAQIMQQGQNATQPAASPTATATP
ncbi:MAG TPA: hypothetical protein VL501_00350 [Pyrinomonadaceae bacterium]|nr:hypothetical protein [Pyrinomonadaceae bacterium]